MKDIIRYIGLYDLQNSAGKRVCCLAAVHKMNYIASAICRSGYNVEIVSPSWMKNDSEIQFEKLKTLRVDDGITATFCPSWSSKTRLTTNIKISFSLFWLFIYLLKNVKRNEKVLVYHVQWLSLPIRLAKFFKRFKLILEVEEIYYDGWSSSKTLRSWEKKLINTADFYLYVSEKLKTKLANQEKFGIVVSGSYINSSGIDTYKKEDLSNCVNLIYAGGIGNLKGAAVNAVKTMYHLDDKFFLNIIGFGSYKDVELLNNEIDKLNNVKGKEVCKYHGTVADEEYPKYLLESDIAINYQNHGDYITYSFPSKIVSFLSYNLRVVSTPLDNIKSSSLASCINFSDDFSMESFAETVSSVDLSMEYDSKSQIQELDENFVKDIGKLLSTQS
jgi:hypothetical protein